MYKINENYQKLPGSYLFSTIAQKVAAYTKAHPDKNLIRLGIGDVTLPDPCAAPGGGRNGAGGDVPGLCAGSGI